MHVIDPASRVGSYTGIAPARVRKRIDHFEVSSVVPYPEGTIPARTRQLREFEVLAWRPLSRTVIEQRDKLIRCRYHGIVPRGNLLI